MKWQRKASVEEITQLSFSDYLDIAKLLLNSLHRWNIFLLYKEMWFMNYVKRFFLSDVSSEFNLLTDFETIDCNNHIYIYIHMYSWSSDVIVRNPNLRKIWSVKHSFMFLYLWTKICHQPAFSFCAWESVYMCLNHCLVFQNFNMMIETNRKVLLC